MKDRQLGVIITIIGILLLVLVISLTPVIKESQSSACVCSGDGATCPHESQLPIQTYLGVILAIVMFYLSYTLFTKKKETKTKKFKIPTDLDKELKDILKEVIKADGAIFQSEIVEKTKLSKVKITRLLDRLEGKSLIERKRRGMTNVVLLKNK